MSFCLFILGEQFDVLNYKLYTSFDEAGRFIWSRSVVFRVPGTKVGESLSCLLTVIVFPTSKFPLIFLINSISIMYMYYVYI